jgi:hypothetical protein
MVICEKSLKDLNYAMHPLRLRPSKLLGENNN